MYSPREISCEKSEYFVINMMKGSPKVIQHSEGMKKTLYKKSQKEEK